MQPDNQKADIADQIGEGERYLLLGKCADAHVHFEIALNMITLYEDSARRKGQILGPLIGVSAAELLNWLISGHHPVLDGLFGGVAGFFAGRAVADCISDELAPLRASANRGLANFYHRNGDYRKARRHYAEALRSDPNDEITRKALGQMVSASWTNFDR